MNEGVFAGAIVGSSLDIGVTLGASSAASLSALKGEGLWHVGVDGNMWWGAAGSYAAATNKISNTGSIIMTAGTFSGSLSGATITGATGTFSGTIDIGGADTTSFHVDAAGQMWSGHADYASAPFKVAANGDAVFASVQITGGTLAVGNSGDANEKFSVGAGGEHWAGHATYGSAPFRVSRQGGLVATSATITGAITATSGSFTGAITGSTIDIGVATAFHVDVNGRMWSGHADFSNGLFSVDAAGAMTATGATITGTITASAGTFGRTTTAGDLSMSVNGASLDFKTVGGTGEVIGGVNTGTMARLWQDSDGLTIMGYVSGTLGRNATSDWIWLDTGSMVFNVSTGDYTWLKATDTTLMTLSESGASAQLKLHSGHISEGGEILLQQATHSNFTTDVYIDNESDQIRIHDGSTVKFLIEMRGEVAGDGKVDGRVRVYGRGIAYNGTMAGGGTRNDMGFSWSSPNIYGHVDGAVAAIIGVVSDRRLKENIQPVVGSDSLAKVMAYRPITYLPLGLDGESDPEAERHTGMIADEVELIDSSLVSGEADDPDQFQSVYYAGVIPDLLQAFQDVVGRLDALELAALEAA
jgi:hypothetical protein